MNDVRTMFLRQSMLDCEEMFAEAIARPDTPTWDWLVVTAANEAQAQAFRAQIDQRLSSGRLPVQTRYAVISDPGGCRVGSGGASLNVMREIVRQEGSVDALEEKRILVLHSGGDSQRIPQYSACGKLFAHVPRSLPGGHPSTLFDEFCISLSCVPARMNGGMLLMSGDVLLLFNALQIDLERHGAACLSIKAPVGTGTRHGVFLADGGDGVQEFLHKQPEEVLRARGAVNAQNMVDIDTGAVWLDAARVRALYGLIDTGEDAFAQFVNEEVRLSLYGDIVYPMSSGATLDGYLAEAAENRPSKALEACRRAIWQAVGETKLALIRLSPAEFIHFGTTREWRDLVLTGEDKYGFLNWRRTLASVGGRPGVAAINSLVHEDAQIGEGSVLEDSRIGPGARIGKGCVLSGVVLLEGELADNTVLHGLAVDGGKAFCARYYGVDDNPKEAARFGKSMDAPLWEAPVHPVLADMEAAVQAALTFGNAPKTSLRDSFARADLAGILAWQAALTDEALTRQIEDSLGSGRPAREVLDDLPAGPERPRLLCSLEKQAQRAAFPVQHRLYAFLSRAVAPIDAKKARAFDDACWQAINGHLMADALASLSGLPAPRIQSAREEVSLPVRVNWGGGWSDTPPYCLEFGGTVLNASLLLDGQRPVYALAQRLDEPIIRIESEDLGVHRDYTQIEAISTGNPHDPHALCKTALVVCGVVPQGGQGPLGPLLERLGGGILLRTAVRNVPKGSGLGTSSILCAAVARALCRLLGQADDDGHISSLALCMEQLMNTGGGWQDQIGGLVPGIKLVSSRPGTPQKLSCRAIPVSDEAFAELGDRSSLVFTGQRRLARGVLRDIMGKAVANEPDTMRVLAEIQRLAVLMAFELETGSIDEFAALLREHWALSKRLDAGSSNTCIDHLVNVCEDLIDGMMICGAGGGGFMYMLRKRGVSQDRLSQRLESVFQESGVKVWTATIER